MSLKTTRHSISPMKAPTAWRIGCTNGLHPCAHSLAVAAWWIQSTPQESGAAGLRTSGTHCMSANLVDSVFAEPARSIQHASTKYDDLCDSGWRARGNTALSSSSARPGTENARSARQTSSSREIAMSLPTSQSLLRSDCELRVKQHAKNQSLRTPPMCHLWQPLCSRHPAEGNLDAHPRNHGVLGEVQRDDPSHHKSAAIHTC